MGLVTFLMGCGRQPTSPPTASPSKDAQLIDYAHESGGVFYHGTFSLIDGKVGATWTVDDGKGKKSQDITMTDQAFKSIWDSVADISDFKAGAIKDPNQQMDPSTAHVIGVISNLGGQQRMQTYLIPSAAASPAFRDWLSKIGYTGK